jgi:hypothetical protein
LGLSALLNASQPYNNNYSLIVAGHVCIDIRVTSLHNGASWTYGPCSFASNTKKENNETTKYVEKCCLSAKENTLTCRDSEKKGWRGGYLVIQGNKHCHDFFVGYTAKRKITVLGRHLVLIFQLLQKYITLLS